MKSSMKKLAVLVIVSVIALFTVVAVASADGRNSQLLLGTYSFTGSGNCVASMGTQYFFTLIQIWEGEYTFDGHGSGTFKGTFRAVDLPPGGLNGPNAPSKAIATWEFEYRMTDHNQFETWLKPGTLDKIYDSNNPNGPPVDFYDIQGDTFHGAVERDGASIVVTSGPPMMHNQCKPPTEGGPLCDPTGVVAICSESVIGLRVR